MSIISMDESALVVRVAPVDLTEDTVEGSKPSEISRNESGAHGNKVRVV